MPTALPCPPEARIYTLDGEKHTGISAFIDHLLSKDVRITPEQAEMELKQAKDLGFENVHEAIGSVSKRSGTKYDKFADIPREELLSASRERNAEKFDTKVDAAAKKLIERLSAKLPEGTQKLGAGDFEKVIRGAADIIKKAYRAGGDIKEAIDDAIKYMKDAWNESMGEFNEKDMRDAMNDMYDQFATGVFAQNTDRASSKDNRLKPIDFPELVQIARQLADGRFPITKAMIDKLGYFSPTLKKIVLNKELFKEENYDDLLKTISHEIGHFIDYIPEDTMSRGNILGRIASLKDFMKQYLPFEPGAEGELTAADKQRIAKEVKKTAKGVTKEIDEEIETKIGLDPKDVLDIWNSVDAGRNNPELLDFIQSLSDADKKSIVVQAMKGIVSSQLDKFVKIIKEKTGRKISVTEFPDKAEIEKAIKDKIAEEIRKRKLWNEREVYKEAYELSKEWRPFDEGSASKKEMDYRKDSKEVYADMISVLFNSPGTLEAKAPKFFEAFMNYLGNKPEFKAMYEDTMKMLADPLMVDTSRTENVAAGYEAGRQKRKEIQRNKALKSAQNVWDTFKNQFISIASSLYGKIPGDIGSGTGINKLSPKERVRNAVEQMFMWKSKVALLMDKYKGITDDLSKNSIDIDDVGQLAQFTRNISTARKDKANPLGFQLESHNLDAAKKIFDKYTPEQIGIIDRAMKNFYDTNFDVMQRANDAGLLTPEMWQEVQKHKYDYATFKPVKYLDERLQTAQLLNIKGTLSETTNPFVETMIKISFIQRAAERNNAINVSKEALEKFAASSVKETTFDYRGKPKDKLESNQEYVYHKVNGKTKVFITDKDVARIFNTEEPEKINVAIKAINALSAPLKAAWTRFNPGFVFYNNLIKDGMRSLSNTISLLRATDNVKASNFLTLGIEYLRTIPSAFREAKNILKNDPSELGKAMLANGAVNPESAIFSKYNPEMDAMGNIFSHFEATQQHLGIEKMKKSILDRIGDVLLWLPETLVSKPGQKLEMMNKVIGYKMLEKRLGKEAAAYYTRNYIGTPNYSEKTAANYSFIPFAKVIVQGIRNDILLATGKRSAGAYWMAKALYSVVPAVLLSGAKNGWFDDEDTPKGQRLSDAYNNLSKYQRYNYINIVTGITTDGNTGLVQVPMDDISKVVFQEVMNLFEDESAAAHFRDILQPITQQLPDYRGGLKFYENWGEFLIQGQNPYDDFYHRNIISSRNFKQGGTAAAGDMLKYTLNTLGLRLPEKDFGEKTTAKEKALAMPLINRIYKETHAGVYDMIKNVRANTDKAAAQRMDNIEASIESAMTDDLRKSMTESGYNSSDVDYIAKEAYANYSGKSTAVTDEEKIDYRTIKAKVKLMYQKTLTASIPIANAILDANTYAEKEAILEEYKKHASEQEYDELIQVLDDNDIPYDREKKKSTSSTPAL